MTLLTKLSEYIDEIIACETLFFRREKKGYIIKMFFLYLYGSIKSRRSTACRRQKLYTSKIVQHHCRNVQAILQLLQVVKNQFVQKKVNDFADKNAKLSCMT